MYYSQNDTPLSRSVMPEDYREYGQIAAVTADGERIVYGNPFANDLNKLETAIDAAVRGDTREFPCGIEAASAHTRVITWLQQNETVRNFAETKIRRTDAKVYVPGLGEALLDCFRHPERTLAEWTVE